MTLSRSRSLSPRTRAASPARLLHEDASAARATSIADLPDEVLAHVFRETPTDALVMATGVSRHFRAVAQDDHESRQRLGARYLERAGLRPHDVLAAASRIVVGAPARSAPAVSLPLSADALRAAFDAGTHRDFARFPRDGGRTALVVDKKVYLVDLKTGAVDARDCHFGRRTVSDIDFTADGDNFYAIEDGSRISKYMMNPRSGEQCTFVKEVLDDPRAQGKLSRIACAPKGDAFVVSCEERGPVLLFEDDEDREPLILPVHYEVTPAAFGSSCVPVAAWSKDGSTLVTATDTHPRGGARTIETWDARDPSRAKLRITLPLLPEHDVAVQKGIDIAFDRDGDRLLVTSGNRAFVFDATDLKAPPYILEGAYRARFTLDGEGVLASARDDANRTMLFAVPRVPKGERTDLPSITTSLGAAAEDTHVVTEARIRSAPDKTYGGGRLLGISPLGTELVMQDRETGAVRVDRYAAASVVAAHAGPRSRGA